MLIRCVYCKNWQQDLDAAAAIICPRHQSRLRWHQQIPCCRISCPKAARRFWCETVLVAEDEGNIREFIASVLISLGYHVVEASDGEVAFSLFKGTLSGKVDLVLTDIIMPKINGKELACLVEKDEPLTKVLFCSGYPEKLAARNGMIDPKFPFIQKPFSPEILASKVRDVLDAPYPAEPLFQEDHA